MTTISDIDTAIHQNETNWSVNVKQLCALGVFDFNNIVDKSKSNIQKKVTHFLKILVFIILTFIFVIMFFDLPFAIAYDNKISLMVESIYIIGYPLAIFIWHMFKRYYFFSKMLSYRFNLLLQMINTPIYYNQNLEFLGMFLDIRRSDDDILFFNLPDHYNLNEIFNQAYFVINPIQPLTQHHPDQFTTDELLVLLDIHDTYHEYYEFQSNLMHTGKRVTMMRRIRKKNGILNSNNETTLKKDEY